MSISTAARCQSSDTEDPKQLGDNSVFVRRVKEYTQLLRSAPFMD